MKQREKGTPFDRILEITSAVGIVMIMFMMVAICAHVGMRYIFGKPLNWVIDVSTIDTDKVVFGATVTVYDDESESESTYRIVGEDESDIKQGLISVSSPVAKALIGHRVDDEVQVKVPSGIRIYEIIDIKYV